jgi:EmrB/QacA subfamily drug resistance transporter
MAMPLFLLAADINGVTVALARIGDELNTSTSGLQWIVNIYLLTFASFLLPMGRLADLYGRRLICLGGLVGFAAASLVSALAPTIEILLLGRALQGIGAAMLFSTSLSLVSAAFPPEERARGIGIWSGLGVSGAAIGPLLGGALTDAASWRWFFLINVPIALVAIVLTLRSVPESRDPTAAHRLDLIGFVTATLGLLAIIFAIQQIDTDPVTSAIVMLPLISGIVLLAAFTVIELRQQEPLIDLRLFRGIDFLSSAVVGMISQWLFFSISFLAALYLQNVLGLSPLEAGIVFLALAVPFVLASLVNGPTTRVLGIKVAMTAGTALTGVGAVLLTLVGTGKIESVALVTVAYVFLGVGLSWSVNISTTGGMVAIDDAKAGVASGALSASKFVFAALGVAIVGALFKTTEADDLGDAIVEAGAPSSERGEVEGLLSGSDAAAQKLTELAPGLQSNVEQATDDAFVAGLVAAMVLNVVIAAVGVGIGLLYRKPKPDESVQAAQNPSA